MDKEKVKGTILKSMSKSNKKTKTLPKTSASQTLLSSKKKTDIRRKYKTRSYKKNNIMRRQALRGGRTMNMRGKLY